MIKPLLASAIESAESLTYPLLASPKLDGIRCIILGGKALTRSLKEVPNRHVQNILGNSNLEGLDGELLVGNAMDNNAWNYTTSGIMSRDGTPDFKFHVFDDFMCGKTKEFHERLTALQHRFLDHPYIEIVPHDYISNPQELDEYENMRVLQGYEGVMLRDPSGLYKYGRSTLKEGILLKMKRFMDSEAIVQGFVEQLHNSNEATINALGHTERSSHKAGMVGKGTLGALIVRSEAFKNQFQIGSGFTAAQRQEIWDSQDKYLFSQLRFKYQPAGVLDAPRFPIFQGWRLD